MRRTTLCALALAWTLPACSDITEPDDAGRTAVVAATHTANAAFPLFEVDPPLELPPVERAPTFWTCAAEAEARFAAALTRALVLEAQALSTADPFRQSVLLAEVARIRHEAQKALHFALTVCVDTYGAPRLFALPDANGNLVFQPFSVAVYHGYLVRKHLGS